MAGAGAHYSRMVGTCIRAWSRDGHWTWLERVRTTAEWSGPAYGLGAAMVIGHGWSGCALQQNGRDLHTGLEPRWSLDMAGAGAHYSRMVGTCIRAWSRDGHWTWLERVRTTAEWSGPAYGLGA